MRKTIRIILILLLLLGAVIAYVTGCNGDVKNVNSAGENSTALTGSASDTIEKQQEEPNQGKTNTSAENSTQRNEEIADDEQDYMDADIVVTPNIPAATPVPTRVPDSEHTQEASIEPQEGQTASPMPDGYYVTSSEPIVMPELVD